MVTGTLNFEDEAAAAAAAAAADGADGEQPPQRETFEIKANIVVCSTGHNRDMLKYEGGRAPGWQTAYGIEVKMPGKAASVRTAAVKAAP